MDDGGEAVFLLGSPSSATTDRRRTTRRWIMTTLVPAEGFPLSPIAFEDMPLGTVYGHIEPGPVVLLTTCHEGHANVMAMSWHMMVDFDPPLIACIVAGGDHSAAALDATGDCVVAIPSVDLAKTVVAVGNCSGRQVDKFADFDLTPARAAKVGAPIPPSPSATACASSRW
jgi:hypothetical protein